MNGCAHSQKRRKARSARLGIIATVLLLAACGGGPSDFVADMDDFSYGGRRGGNAGTSAAGEPVGFDRFAGSFVWVDYSAPWCGPCVRQAPVIARLEHAFGDKVVFVTVLTSDQDPRVPSTRHTARAWASRFRLDPDRVLAGTEGQRFIPTHVVFSPLGQTLHRRVGLQSEAQIRASLQSIMREWDQWYEENKNSTSVMLSEIGE